MGRIFSKSQKSGEGAEQEKMAKKRNATVDRGKGGRESEKQKN